MWLGATGPSHCAPLALTAQSLTFGVLTVLALGFGVLWTAVNFYQCYPIAQTAVEWVADRLTGNSAASTASPLENHPTIDILLPAYEESTVIEQAIRSVRTTSYPQNRLNLYILLEPDDEETQSALENLDEFEFTTLIIPSKYPGEPNKPRALNYGFEHTEAEIIGIVDAEDIVDPNLFSEATRELESGRDFVQARLDMVNEGDGWLNTLFRAEYGFWYQIVLPAFERVGYPLPLSGTSCLFRRSLLVAASVEREECYDETIPRTEQLWTGVYRLAGWSPWDPKNVTEDFELGLFLWQRGFDVGYLQATTAEESPLSLNAWMKQRTRWKKGKLQTLLKYCRVPPAGLRFKAHLFWQSALPHVGPVNLAGCFVLIAVANAAKFDPNLVLGAVLSLGLAFVIISTVLFSTGYWLASDKPISTRSRRATTIALTVPIYWLLQWLADLRALKQTYNGWFGWERIAHHGRNVADGSISESDGGPKTHLNRGRRVAWLSGIVLGGAILRFVSLDARSLWTDEIYSIAVRADMSFPAMLVVPNDPHPPLYFLLLRAWMAVFGQTAISARALSAVLSIGAIPALYFLGKELFDDRVGLIAAGFFALSTYQIHFARTARMYSLFALLTIGSWYYFVRLSSDSPLDTSGYILTSAALLYTHAFGMFVLLAQNGFMALSETKNGISLMRWAKAQAGIGVLAGPAVAFYAWRMLGPLVASGAGAAIEWIPVPSTIALVQTVLSYVGYPVHYPVLAESTSLWVVATGISLVVLGLVIVSVVTYRFEDGYHLAASRQTGQAAMLLTVPVVVPFVASYVIPPIYAPRFTLPASLGLYLLAGAGLVNVPSGRARRVVLLVFLVGTAPMIGAYYAGPNVEDWDGAVDSFEGDTDSDDLVVFQPSWIRTNVDFYYQGEVPQVVTVNPDWRAAEDTGFVVDRLAEHDTIWIVTYRSDPAPGLDTALSTRNQTVHFRSGTIRVYRYERS